MSITLKRSKNKVLAGVCGGIAERFDWNPALTRMGYFLLSVLSIGFPGILVYIVLWILMPSK